MGQDNKLLLEVGGTPLVRASVQGALASKARSTIVVLGHEADTVAGALDGLDCRHVINEDYTRGLSSSLRTGVGAAAGYDGVAILLADMPRVEPAILDTLFDVFVQRGARSVVVAAHRGRRGHPVIWPAACFADLAALTGDRGGRLLFEKYADRIVEVDVGSDSIFLDIDTHADLASANAS